MLNKNFIFIIRVELFTYNFVVDWYESDFKPNLIEQLGEGGFAKVFKANFHSEDVAMKYIPLDKVKDQYEYKQSSYGLHELDNQEEVRSRRSLQAAQ